MLEATTTLLQNAQQGGYAIGAFNVYNLEGVRAVVAAAEAGHCPAMLQLHPAALAYGGTPLVALCRAAAQEATVPLAVHLDHSSSPAAIGAALDAGISSIMADGSHLPYAANTTFTREMVVLAHRYGAAVEAELGRLSGSEDGLTVDAYEALLTDPEQARAFVLETGVDALAVCIGNVHGRYASEPHLDLSRLRAIRAVIDIPLVLHGASGLPDGLVQQTIALGVTKFNVNTELREAYLTALRTSLSASEPLELLDVMRHAVAAMQKVVMAKLRCFGAC